MYIYSNHMGGIYGLEVRANPKYLYCDTCGDSDCLIGEADNFIDALQLVLDYENIDAATNDPYTKNAISYLQSEIRDIFDENC